MLVSTRGKKSEWTAAKEDGFAFNAQLQIDRSFSQRIERKKNKQGEGRGERDRGCYEILPFYSSGLVGSQSQKRNHTMTFILLEISIFRNTSKCRHLSIRSVLWKRTRKNWSEWRRQASLIVLETDKIVSNLSIRLEVNNIFKNINNVSMTLGPLKV